MKIVIVGAGQVGTSMAEILSRENNDISLIDVDESRLSGLQDRMDIRTVSGPGSYPSILEQAGCIDADLILAVTDQDEVNMVACQLAHSLFRTPKRIARIRSMDYLNHKEIFCKETVPIDVIISPEEIITNHIQRLIEYPGALQVVDFAAGKIQLVAVYAIDGGPLVGQELKEIRKHMPKVDTRVAAIYRRDRPIIPEGDTVIEPGDEVFFIAATRHIRAVMSELQIMDKPGRRIMIAGAGNIGYNLAANLEHEDYRVKITERSAIRAQRVADQLENAVVLQGDAADEELMRQENIESIEVFCSLTSEDEANILSAMLAKRLGAKRVMAIINRAAYVDLIESSTIDIAISPRLMTVGSLLTHVRRGDVVAVHSLRRGAAEAIAATAHGDAATSKVVGKRVNEIKLPPGATLGAILRGEDVIIAHGDTLIETGDHVILFVINKKDIPDVEKLFQVAFDFI